ncbi:hypothetical protein TomTYG45_02430 [Sphingobium sp. TomTYG45]
MEAFGDQFLARATLTHNQDGAIEFGGAPGLLDSVKEGQRLADELGVSFHGQIMVKIATYWQDILEPAGITPENPAFHELARLLQSRRAKPLNEGLQFR